MTLTLTLITLHIENRTRHQGGESTPLLRHPTPPQTEMAAVRIGDTVRFSVNSLLRKASDDDLVASNLDLTGSGTVLYAGRVTLPMNDSLRACVVEMDVSPSDDSDECDGGSALMMEEQLEGCIRLAPSSNWTDCLLAAEQMPADLILDGRPIVVLPLAKVQRCTKSDEDEETRTFRAHERLLSSNTAPSVVAIPGSGGFQYYPIDARKVLKELKEVVTECTVAPPSPPATYSNFSSNPLPLRKPTPSGVVQSTRPSHLSPPHPSKSNSRSSARSRVPMSVLASAAAKKDRVRKAEIDRYFNIGRGSESVRFEAGGVVLPRSDKANGRPTYAVKQEGETTPVGAEERGSHDVLLPLPFPAVSFDKGVDDIFFDVLSLLERRQRK